MRNKNSLQEIAEINCLLANIKKEYEQGIRPVLLKNSSAIYTNPHKIPKLKKIQINRSLGLAASNNNILKKKYSRIYSNHWAKTYYYKSEKSYCRF